MNNKSEITHVLQDEVILTGLRESEKFYDIENSKMNIPALVEEIRQLLDNEVAE
jgi:hypothetical protein